MRRLILALALAGVAAPACAQPAAGPAAPRMVCVPATAWAHATAYAARGPWEEVDPLMRELVGASRAARPCDAPASPPAPPAAPPGTPPADTGEPAR